MSEQLSILDEFVAEAKDHLNSIEERFLEMEKTAEHPDKDLVNQVFRSIHSIKGAAGFLSLDTIKELSHVMETLLQMIRTGEIKPFPTVIAPLLEGADLLKSMVYDTGSSNSVDIKAICKKLNALIHKNPQAEEELGQVVAVREMGQSEELPFLLDEFTLSLVPAHCSQFYVLSYDLSSQVRVNKITPVALIMELMKTSEVLDVSAEVLVDDLGAYLEQKPPIICSLLYATMLGPDLIHEGVGLPPEKVRQIEDPRVKLKAPVGPEASALGKHEALAVSASPAPEKNEAPVEPVHLPEVAPDSAPAKPVGDIKSTKSNETIRLPVEILDRLMTLAGELVLVRNQQLLNTDMNNPVCRGITQRLDLVTSELQDTIMRTRMQPIGNLFAKLPRICHDLSEKLGKKIELELLGKEVELDKNILEALSDPLTHIIRNSCDHGVEMPEVRRKAGKPECGRIVVKAAHESGQINLSITDDGKGINPVILRKKAVEKGFKTEAEVSAMSDKDALGMILLPGFSTAEKLSEVSGRGVGMDVVKTSIEKLGGTLDLSSVTGSGSTVKLQVPLTLAIIPSRIVEVGGERFAIPQVNLEELVSLFNNDVIDKIEQAMDQEVYRLRQELLPMVRITEVLARVDAFDSRTRAEIAKKYRMKALLNKGKMGSLSFAVVKSGFKRFGLIVDNIIGIEEIVVKPMHPEVRTLSIYSGVTVMGDGLVSLIFDIEGLAKHSGIPEIFGSDTEETHNATSVKQESQAVLLFQYGPQETFALPLPLIRRIEKISMSKVELAGNKEYIAVDGISTRILRLEEALKTSTAERADQMYLLLPMHIKKPFGILISRLSDVVNVPAELNIESHMQDGLLGTLLVRDHMTLFLDIFRLIEKAEPQWFAHRKASAVKPEAKKRLLLVEDTNFFLQLVKGYLEDAGFEVSTAVNGREGLAMLEAGPFDLVISDIEMPVMNGFEFLKALRAGVHADLPCLALTSLSSEADRKLALEAGFDEYRLKINREDLLETVAELLGHTSTKNNGGRS